MGQRISISISIDKDIDTFLQKCTQKVIEIDGHSIVVTKTKNELYNLALAYALEKVDRWLFLKKNED